MTIAPGPGVTKVPVAALQVDSWPDAGVDPATFVNWTTGFLTARYVRSRVTISPVGAVPVLSAFTPTADKQAKTDSGTATATIGGTFVAFNLSFHKPPFVMPVPIGAGLTASATGVTALGFTLQIFSGTTDVGGSVNWRAQGI